MKEIERVGEGSDERKRKHEGKENEGGESILC